MRPASWPGLIRNLALLQEVYDSFHGYSLILKKLKAFFVVMLLSSSNGISRSSAIFSATNLTYDGSFLLPRYGWGAKNGASVSTSSRSSGTSTATSLGRVAFLNVTGPPSEM